MIGREGHNAVLVVCSSPGRCGEARGPPDSGSEQEMKEARKKSSGGLITGRYSAWRNKSDGARSRQQAVTHTDEETSRWINSGRRQLSFEGEMFRRSAGLPASPQLDNSTPVLLL